MKSISIFAILLCFVEAKKIISPRVVHGQLAQDSMFPYMAGLSFTNHEQLQTWCGGALISHEWIVTAAHCVYGQHSAIAYLGSNQMAKGVSHPVHNTIIAPQYVHGVFNHDIALVNISAVSYSEHISPTALPNARFNLQDHSIATASGWGYVSTNGPHSENLLYTDLRVISNYQCQNYYPMIFIGDSHLCALPAGDGATCYGDSGGPLVEKRSRVLVGIVAFHGQAGCLAGEPDGFTRITTYMGWIRNHTGINT